MKNRIAPLLAALTVAACAAPSTPPPSAAAAPAAAPACKPAPTDLVVKDIEVGKGRDVRHRTAVHMGYTGWLYDGCADDLKGKKFDSSEGRSTPFGFVVGAGRVIKGWDEGVAGMKEGGKRTLIIPPSKGYGEKGAGDAIPPNATLVFDVEVLNVIMQGDGKP